MPTANKAEVRPQLAGIRLPSLAGLQRKATAAEAGVVLNTGPAFDFAVAVATELKLEDVPMLEAVPLPSDTYGEFDSTSRRVRLNALLFTQDPALPLAGAVVGPTNLELEKTIRHELFHAYQFQELRKYRAGAPADMATHDRWHASQLNYKTIRELLAMRDGRGRPRYRTKEAQDAYEAQALERDAFAFETTAYVRSDLIKMNWGHHT